MCFGYILMKLISVFGKEPSCLISGGKTSFLLEGFSSLAVLALFGYLVIFGYFWTEIQHSHDGHLL